MLLESSCVWLADDTGWGGVVRREERTGHSLRGGGREAGRQAQVLWDVRQSRVARWDM